MIKYCCLNVGVNKQYIFTKAAKPPLLGGFNFIDPFSIKLGRNHYFFIAEVEKSKPKPYFCIPIKKAA
ncbi:MAG: hypothetical protein EAY75_04835 [Bacteroidetes bacterium]|nr:MAG: hypothetical protein EAY75_04835 [Bacteroidota bacterium]